MLCGSVRSLVRSALFRKTNFTLQKAFLASEAFESAVSSAKKLPRVPSNDVKLKLYAFYKQATIGKNTTPKPGMLSIVEKYKWDAWSALGDMSREEAEKNYICLVEKLGMNGIKQEEERKLETKIIDEDTSVEGLAVSFNEGVLTFRLNNPHRRNPISLEMYKSITNKLREAATDSQCRVAVITGTGDFYSSGNDFKNFSKMAALVTSESNENNMENPLAAGAELGRVVLSDFQEAFIEFPKPLIALVNGPAVGIMVTTLALCDAVLASEKATFSTPFTSLAQSPEGCSTLTFPLTMGPLVASDVLLFGRVLTAKEAAKYGLVSRVVPAEKFESESAVFVKHVASLPPGSLQASKRLIRGNSGQPLSRSTLLAVSREECQVLAKRWQSEECLSAIANFWSRKKG